MRHLIFGGVLTVLGLSALFPATAQESPRLIAVGPVEAGHRLALNLCSTCHDVSPNQEFPPALLNPAPSLVSIANRSGTNRESLHRFLDSRHGDMNSLPLQMPDLMLVEAQKNAAIAYILSLRTER